MNDRIIKVCRCWAALSEHSKEVRLWMKPAASEGDDLTCLYCDRDVETYNLDFLIRGRDHE